MTGNTIGRVFWLGPENERVGEYNSGDMDKVIHLAKYSHFDFGGMSILGRLNTDKPIFLAISACCLSKIPN